MRKVLLELELDSFFSIDLNVLEARLDTHSEEDQSERNDDNNRRN